MERLDYAPFGGQISRSGYDCYGGTSNEKLLFTGQVRDGKSTAGTETGQDYFNARYLWAAIGRFTSPDAPFADQSPADGQSWNMYAYVRNNPLRYIDSFGRQALSPNTQKMLELLKAPLSRKSGVPKGGLIQLAIEKPIGSLLGEIFGYNPRTVPGDLDLGEAEFLDGVSSFEKGAFMVGVGNRNAPGIDAVDLDNQAGISLKTAEGLNAVGRNAVEGLRQVRNAGFYNVQMYVDARGLTKAQVSGLTKIQGVLGGEGRVTKVVVFARDGVVTYTPTEAQQAAVAACRASESAGLSCP